VAKLAALEDEKDVMAEVAPSSCICSVWEGYPETLGRIISGSSNEASLCLGLMTRARTRLLKTVLMM
jgi:hypothetical protein